MLAKIFVFKKRVVVFIPYSGSCGANYNNFATMTMDTKIIFEIVTREL